nr:hypothetical protein [Tanacetum cinerariifolium]
MDNPNITMEEYIRLEEEKARKHGRVYNWEIATYDKIWYDEDVHNLRSVEIEFPTIVLNDALTYKATLSCEPTTVYGVSKPHGYGVLTTWTLFSLYFSVNLKFIVRLVDMAYSLNEYSVFDTSINTAYPGVWIWRIDFRYSL